MAVGVQVDMKRVLFFALIALLSAEPVASACERADICDAPAARRYPSLARSIGITVDAAWIEANIESIHASFAPGCEAFGNCLSVWGNSVDFCRLRFTVGLRAECEKTYDISKDLRGWQQCRAVADVFSMRQIMAANAAWPALQECAAGEAGAAGVASPVVRIEPADPAPGVATELVVEAYQPGTGYPMYGLISIGGTRMGETFQPVHYALRFEPVTDEWGRITLRTPEVLVEPNPARGSNAPPFAAVRAAFATAIPETVLSFEPPPAEWKSGANVIRVTARDAASGEALEGRILKSGDVLGDVGEPVTIVLSGDDRLCGDPVWFRPRQGNRPDTDFPIPPCR